MHQAYLLEVQVVHEDLQVPSGEWKGHFYVG